MKKELYRFRRVENLIGEEYEELDRQSIYFAAPESLNDPMEGFRDLYWDGDFIVWRNLFCNYLLCLERLYTLLLLSSGDDTLSANDMPIFSGEDNFPTDMYKKMFSEISEKFFKNKNLIALVEQIANRSTPVRRDELSLYFRSIHPFALEVISLTYEIHGLIPTTPHRSKNSDEAILGTIDIIRVVEKGLSEVGHDDVVTNTIFSIQRDLGFQLELIRRYNGIIGTDQKNKNFVISEFPEQYVAQIEKLVFPEWYTACFMSECKNSSVWGHYGDNHSGVCLIFETEDINGDHFLKLTSHSGDCTYDSTHGFRNYKFYPIDYEHGFGKIDFFRMLGRLPVSTLNAVWYGLDGELSPCSDDMLSSEDTWRADYWKKFFHGITHKSQDWSYENEYRLILSSLLDSFTNSKDRVLTYDFRSLKGVIFGVKTKTEHKLSIIKTIEKKCKAQERDDFKFYRAHYSADQKCIIHSELSLLKFMN